jgi:hypothetical protein
MLNLGDSEPLPHLASPKGTLHGPPDYANFLEAKVKTVSIPRQFLRPLATVDQIQNGHAHGEAVGHLLQNQ